METITCEELKLIRKACVDEIITNEVALIKNAVIAKNSLGGVMYEKPYPWRYKDETIYPNLTYDEIGKIASKLQKIFVDSKITYCETNKKGEILIIIKWE